MTINQQELFNISKYGTEKKPNPNQDWSKTYRPVNTINGHEVAAQESVLRGAVHLNHFRYTRLTPQMQTLFEEVEE